MHTTLNGSPYGCTAIATVPLPREFIPLPNAAGCRNVADSGRSHDWLKAGARDE